MKLLLLAAALAATAVSARPSPALVRQMHSPAQAKYPHYERVQPRFVHHDEEGYGSMSVICHCFALHSGHG